MSRSSFAQRFKASFLRSPMDFLKALRLRQAAQLRISRRYPINSIAEQIGCESRSRLSRSFTGFCDSAPAGFRSSAQKLG